MGSESDLEIMKGAAEMLRQFEVEPELTIVSAHRTPQRLREYASKAKDRGLKVIHSRGWWCRSFARHGGCTNHFTGYWGSG
jgi:phosphoribosylaminoimidazole carboxylase PurE protein